LLVSRLLSSPFGPGGRLTDRALAIVELTSMTNLERAVRIFDFKSHVTHIVTVYYGSKPESTVANRFQNRIGDDE
jgi:hypothetical protein